MELIEKIELRNKIATANNRLSDDQFFELLWEFRTAESNLDDLSLARTKINDWIKSNYDIL